MKIWIIGLALLAALVSRSAVAYEPVSLITQEALIERLRQGDDQLLILDVRTPEEYVAGHVPGAVNVPHDALRSHLASIPKDKDVVLYCRSGRRAGFAAATLQDNGYTRLLQLEGDMIGWLQSERAVDTPADPAACAAALAQGAVASPLCAPR